MKKLCIVLVFGVQAVITWGVFATTALGGTNQVANLDSGIVDIQYENDLISAEIDEAPLIQVLREIEKKTGAQWILKDRSLSDDLLSIEIEETTLEKALKRMLKNYSYVTQFDSRGVVSKVIVYATKYVQPANSGKAVAYSGSSALPATGTANISAAEPKVAGAVGDLEASEVPGSLLQADEAVAARGENENEDLSGGSSPNAAYVPHDLDDYQPLPEELPDEGIGAAEYDENDPAAGSLAAERQAQLEERRRQARLERAKNALNSEYTHLRAMAVEELVATKDKRATSALESFANSTEASTDERSQAAQALWNHAADLEFADPEANAALVRLANDADPSVRKIANQALSDMERYQRRHGQ